ncbi:MAG: hypothetical protein H3C35_08540 [Bacteroidetes bacterium]|nr:hypothetical protein [Bacteroidota bacterium]
MANQFMHLEKIYIVGASAAADVDTISEVAALTTNDLGDLKGSPFAKVTFDPKSINTQNGDKTLGKNAKVEISALILPNDTIAATMRALEGTKVVAFCVPKGTVGAGNPIVVIKNWLLQIKGEFNIGEASFLTFYNDNVPILDETDIFGTPITS